VSGALNATGADVTLTGSNVSLDASVTGENITLTAQSGGITLENLFVGNDLNVTAEGDIGQVGPLAVPGATTLDAAGDITLDNAANNFTGSVTAEPVAAGPVEGGS